MDFNKYAGSYDSGWKGSKSARFYDDLIRELEIHPGDSVLDVGCGTGTVLSFIGSKTAIKGHGLDISPKMLEIEREKNPDFDYRVGDCVTLPYEDESMDVVMACMAYHHFPEQGRFRNEAFRVLRPNGRLYICDPRFPWAVRTILNACFKEAGFHTTKRNAGDFIASGFKLEKLTEDLYVQVLSMKKPDEHEG